MKQIILMSIRPEWVAKILNGVKTVEIRKTALHEGDEVHIYCTKARPYLISSVFVTCGKWCLSRTFWDEEYAQNGKVVAKFIVGKVERIDTHPLDNREQFPMSIVMSKWEKFNDILKKACLLADQLDEYSGYHKFKEKPVYALSITKLEIFDKPRELGEYYAKYKCHSCESGYESSACDNDETCMFTLPITHAPQSYCHAWVEE